MFTECSNGLVLRSYQLEPARAICQSVLDDLGLSFVVIFPRQSGKNELQAQIESYLLALCSVVSAEIVKISPTWKPQSQNAMRRLQRVLEKSLVLKSRWQKESGYIYRVDKARVYFFSGQPEASIVGATASTLLEVDEAQDVSIDKYDKEIAPMAASTNATRVFWGTAWTARTLLARELANVQKDEERDGIRRSWILTADQVAAELPAYGKYVQEQISKLGRNHPMIRTQYFSETIDADGGMFNKQRQALMQGSHKPQVAPAANAIYAITIDVAGEDEAAREELGAMLQNPGRDSTALTVFEVLVPAGDDPLLSKPTYSVVSRHQWTGIKHASLLGRIIALVDLWSPAWIVIDATGVGQTIASFLMDRYSNITLPFTFTSSSKSQLGWDFLAVIETGRYKEYVSQHEDRLHSAFWDQVDNCQYHIVEGPGQIMRWGVPDGTRHLRTGDLVHDDLLISAALVTQLDSQSFGLAKSSVVAAPDIFERKDF